MHGLACERVICVGTVSKTLAPGLRIGWLLLPSTLLDDLTRAKLRAQDRGGSRSTPDSNYSCWVVRNWDTRVPARSRPWVWCPPRGANPECRSLFGGSPSWITAHGYATVARRRNNLNPWVASVGSTKLTAAVSAPLALASTVPVCASAQGVQPRASYPANRSTRVAVRETSRNPPHCAILCTIINREPISRRAAPPL